MTVSAKEVKKIAHLARIRLTDEQSQRFGDEMSNIMDWIDQLKEVDTDNTDPTYSTIDTPLPLRSDEVTDGNITQQVLKNAPKHQYGCFSVPKVIE